MLKSLKEKILANDISKTGLLLGLFGATPVILLAFLYHFAAPQIVKAQAGVEERARSKVFLNALFNSRQIYMLERTQGKGKAYDIFNEVINLSNFDAVKKRKSIEFTVLENNDKLLISDRKNLKQSPLIINKEQFIKLKAKFKNARIKLTSYSEAFVPVQINTNSFAKDIITTLDKEKKNKDKDLILSAYNKDDNSASYLLKKDLNFKQISSVIRILKQIHYKHYNPKKTATGSESNDLSGWVVKYSAPGGYGGNIGMLIGFDTNKKITGYIMVDHNETPGLGVKANADDFINHFIGKDPDKMPLEKKDYKTALGVDSISGATITSLAVSRGIKAAYEKIAVGKDLDAEMPKIGGVQSSIVKKEDLLDKEKKEPIAKENEANEKQPAKEQEEKLAKEKLAKEAKEKETNEKQLAKEQEEKVAKEKLAKAKRKARLKRNQANIAAKKRFRKSGRLSSPSHIPPPQKLNKTDRKAINKLFKED